MFPLPTWKDTAVPIDRSKGEGPAPCCNRHIVAADELVFVGNLPAPTLTAIRTARPDLVSIIDADLWLCSSCIGQAFNHKYISREEWVRGHGLPASAIAAAWVHDEEFWRRGLDSAPPEVTSMPWWSAMQALYAQADAAQAAIEDGAIPVQAGRGAATPNVETGLPVLTHPGQLRGAIKNLLQDWNPLETD